MRRLKYFLIVLLLCNAQAATTIINSFNTGEMSPLLNGRTDVAKYYSGCQTLENFIPLPYGGVTRRPGTKYIASAKTATGSVRLIPFEFSITQAYILEFGDEYMRVYKDGGQVQSGGAAYEITTPYDSTDLFELQHIQSADTMYIVHPDYAPRKLTRTGHTSWTITAITFSRGPFLVDNITDTTITPSAKTGSITLTASADTFNANHVGALWQVTHTVPGVNASASFSNSGSDQNTVNVTVQLGRTFDFSTHGTWTGDIVLQRSYDSGSVWKDVRPVHYEDDGNIQYSDEEIVDDAIYRVYVAASGAGIDSGTCNINLTARSFDVDGVVDIWGFTSATVISGNVVNTLGGTTAVTEWAEGAWSADEGYPGAIAFYEERIAYAATNNRPQTIWMSQTNDWDNFLAGTLDTDAFNNTIASNQVNVIRWLASQTSLLIGTTSAEWKMSAGTFGEPINFGNATVRRQSSYGSEYLQPNVVNNVVLFVQRQGKKVRELVYNFENDVYVAPDMTVLAEHITGDGIVGAAFQRTPDPILWCVTSDGDLISMTYNREQDVIAWAKQIDLGPLASDKGGAYPTLQPANDSAFETLPQSIPISNVAGLQAMKNDLRGNYYLIQDIDASATSSWNGGLGFDPIGDTGIASSFNGTFDGGGYTISDLFIDRPTDNGVGLFGWCGDDTDGGTESYTRIQNVTLEDADITGARYVGVLAGDFTGYDMKAQGCHASGTITTTHTTVNNIGGLFGNVNGGIFSEIIRLAEVRDCSSSVTVDVTGSADTNVEYVGGFAGLSSYSIFYNSSCTGNVLGSGRARGGCGGFVGFSEVAQYYDCSATGNITCKNGGGGFVGEIEDEDRFERCSATGNVTVSSGYGGGFVYRPNDDGGVILNCYAWGNVDTSADNFECGGFIQYNSNVITIENAYCIGSLDGGTASEGGFLQFDDDSGAAYTATFWDEEASGITLNATGSAKALTTTEAQTQSTYEDKGWNFKTIWEILGPEIKTGEGVESIAIIPGTTEDEIWISVLREIEGSTVRYIEQFQPRDWGDERRDAFLVDSGLTFDGGSSNDISGISKASPTVVNVSHGYSDGDQIRITSVEGMTELNDNVYTISNPTSLGFELRDSTDSVDIDSTGFITYISGGTVEQVENTFVTLTHLESETLDIQGDGGYYGQETVSGGTIVLDDFFNTVHAGLPYTSKLLPMPIATSGENIQGRTKRMTANTVRLNETLGVKIGDSWDSYDPVVFRDQTDPLEAAPPLFTGLKKISFTGGYEIEGNIYIQQDEPLPCTVISIMPEFEVYR